MPIDPITVAIIDFIERGLVFRTVEELTKAISNALGIKVTKRRVKASLNRNRHRITFQSGQFTFTIEHESKR